MTRFMIQVLVALVTFAIGLASAKLVANLQPPPQSITIKINQALKTTPFSLPITFSESGFVTAFQPHYHSSDGVRLRYGCFEYPSPVSAAQALRKDIFGQHIIERTSKLNNKGERIGERVVLGSRLGSETEAKIIWTEGARRYLLRAPSLKYVLLFEQSRVWANDDYCF